MRHFFTNQILAEGPLKISGTEAYHMLKVLRLAPGDQCVVVNGHKQKALGLVIAADKNSLELAVSNIEQGAAPLIKLAVLQGFLKERKLDDLIRPLSELGVSEFGAILTRRSVPRPDAKRLDGRLERWRKLSIEALKQCRGSELMQIKDVLTLEAALKNYADFEVKLFLWEGATLRLDAVLGSPSGPIELSRRVVIILGPEGGFSDQEAQAAQAHGFIPVSLGTRILRAQTAAVAATAVVQYVLGNLS